MNTMMVSSQESYTDDYNHHHRLQQEQEQEQEVEQQQQLLVQKCFTSIQQQKFWSSSTLSSSSSSESLCSSNIRLCPSMDLIAYTTTSDDNNNDDSGDVKRKDQQSTSSLSASSITLHVHRTLNFQKVASVTVSSLSSDDDDDEQREQLFQHYNKKQQILRSTTSSSNVDRNKSLYNKIVEWRPDGRYIAIALHRTVHIYSIEGLVMVNDGTGINNNTTTTTMTSSTSGSGGGSNNNNSNSNNNYSSTSVLCHNNDSDSATINHGSDTNSVLLKDGGRICTITIPSPVQQHNGNDGRHHTIMNHDDDTEVITSLSWVHLGQWCEHTMWSSSKYSYNSYVQLQSLYQPQQYIDRWMYVLPPSAYHYESHSVSEYYDTTTTTIMNVNSGNHNHGSSSILPSTTTTMNGSIPNQQTPISVLCISTSIGHVSMYIHGRYKIVSNISLLSTNQARTDQSAFHHLPIVASPDLTHYITATIPSVSSIQQNYQYTMKSVTTTPTLTILSFPSLSKNRIHYQTIATLYCNIYHHIQTIQTNVPEIYATWKNTLKPINTKLDGLQKLFLNYGLISSTTSTMSKNDDTEQNNKSNTVRSLLAQYMLSGHTRSTPTLSNAIDQFFTSVQMNDQLIQRMGQTLFQSIIQIEISIRKLLVAPATALVYELDQLYGLSAYRSDIISCDDTIQLLHTTQHLLLVVNVALTTLIEARNRLRNFVAWIRCTGANIKARGTSTNSVQRENAKKRQVNEGTIQKLLLYLQETNENTNSGKERNAKANNSNFGLVEIILNLGLADILQEVTQSLDTKENIEQQQEEEQKLHQSNQRTYNMNIPNIVTNTITLAELVFELPCALILQSIHRTNIQLICDNPTFITESDSHTMAITTRLGQGGIDLNNIPFGDSPPSGFFSPKSSRIEEIPLDSSSTIRQWLVVAQQQQSNMIQLSAFPLTWTNTVDDEFDDDPSVDDGLYSKSFWTVHLDLPPDCTIHQIAFYGDDGKSTLSSTCDVSTAIGGQEGRQHLGLLISRTKSSSIKDTSVELWLLPYDEIDYSIHSVEPLDSNPEDPNCTVVHARHTRTNISRYTIHPTFTTNNDNEQDDNINEDDSPTILSARTRIIYDADNFSSKQLKRCSMILSGSRGIAAVALNQNDYTSLEILDIEEDEDEDVMNMADDE